MMEIKTNTNKEKRKLREELMLNLTLKRITTLPPAADYLRSLLRVCKDKQKYKMTVEASATRRMERALGVAVN